MEIPKPSEEDKQFFRSLIPEADPEVEIKPMFGNLGAFVHGNMFAGLFGSAVGVRLGEADAGELAAIDGSGPFGPAERPMGGYLSLPGTWRDDADLAARWVEKARAHVGSLPPKVRRSPGRAARRRAGQCGPVSAVQRRSVQGGGHRVVQRGGRPADELAQVAAVDVEVAAG